MGGAVSAGEDNDDLIDNLVEADYIKTSYIERVFRAVDRAHYFTPEFLDNAYKDLAWKWGNLHLSAPCIYSEVMESLNVKPGMSFLNLGSGTGYFSTMVGLILGPHGVNHGIEIHEDAVKHALEKLEEFISTSPAMDEFEFCVPIFVQGNCLKLSADVRQYDRVYCGAACPDYHENYMKNLIKVGGILVMPLNDQLLQITRTDETTWNVKPVLPVSFAPLVLPELNDATVVLPDNEPLSLLELCRTTIRSVLRQCVEMEHPEVRFKQPLQPKKKYRKKILRRLVIPIFGESDSEDFGGIIQDETDEREFRRRFLYDVHNQRAGQFAAVIELTQNIVPNRFWTRQSSESTSDEGKESSSNESGEEACALSSNEALEVEFNHCDILNEAKELEVDVEKIDEDSRGCTDKSGDQVTEVTDKKMMDCEFSASKWMADSVAEPSEPRIPFDEQRKKIPKRKKSDGSADGIHVSYSDHEGEDTFIDFDSDSDFFDGMPSLKRTYQIYKNQQIQNPGVADNPLGAPRGNTVFWRRVPFANDENEEEGNASDNASGADASNMPNDVPFTPTDNYSVHMRAKIQQLPLPPMMKAFLNLNREF